MSNNPLRRQANRFVYTYDLPYAIRKYICDLFDADQSWQTLGGQHMGLNATQLTLIGQVYMRHGSPTEELLKRLDSANTRIESFCHYIKMMNHCRALEILKPYIYMGGSVGTGDESGDVFIEANMSRESNTLNTPTPSFVSDMTAPPAIMDAINAPSALDFSPSGTSQMQILQSPTMPIRPFQCHNNQNETVDNQQQQAQKDIGEEIVRNACASNRKRTSISDQEVVNQLRLIMQITYNELKQASNNFSDTNILGNGGFASVYWGNWKGTDVAIKRLKCNLMDQALNELTILNSYRIDNILPIYGISIDGPEACLVYQFMSNGSLEDRLSCKKNTVPLSWTQRALIGEGVAKGLFYLHTLRDKPLVHGDVKSANVLLDSQFVPKLGDFGLARQVFKGKNPQSEQCTHCTVSSIHGTSVYLPPEYLRHKILSPAVDVYSYGIVLLEMATGRRAYDGKKLLIDIVEDKTKSISKGQICYSLKDSRLADDSQSDLKIWYELLIKLGLNCAHKIKKKRPDMGQVLDCFATFKAQASQQNHLQNLLNIPLNHHSNSSTNKDNSIAQTTTPNLSPLTAPSNHHRPTQVAYNIINNNNNNKNPMLLNQNNSSLMVVEEQEEPPLSHYRTGNDGLFNVDDSVNNQLQRDSQDVGAVDSMIPLLTELGVKAAKEDQ